MKESGDGFGFFRQILAAATLLLFSRCVYCVSVPPGLTLEKVTDAVCPIGTFHKCLPYGECYSFDEFCSPEARSVQKCFPENLSRDKNKLLVWCLQLKKGEVNLLDPACRFACEYTFDASDLALAPENETEAGNTSAVVEEGHQACHCETCRSSCDYECPCKYSTLAPVTNKCSETNWDDRYKALAIILGALMFVSLSFNVYCCTVVIRKRFPEQKGGKPEGLASSDSSLLSDQNSDDTCEIQDVGGGRRIKNVGCLPTASPCNPLSFCRGRDRVLE